MFGLTRYAPGFALTASVWFAASPLTAEPHGIEVFTVSDQPTRGGDALRSRPVEIRVYEVDGLGHLESVLSKDLPHDADAAKLEALRRIGELDDGQITSGREAADGLAKALQYGVDRYPAIVINGSAVIYGVSDLVEALQRYEAWREAQSR
jgi:integrating conjugative element protein (TIGR03757 family)